jgi:ParB family chromosome partitioning protein
LDRSKTPEKSRLGRGLAALIPGSTPDRAGAAAHAAPTEIPIASIVPNTLQPRTDFDSDALDDLTRSIETHGVLQPVLVRPVGRLRYELVAGERRFRAAQNAGLASIPAVIRELTDEESLTAALIENIQREDLNAIETARGYRQLIEQFGLTQAALARQLGKAQPTIANALRLLRLAAPIQDSIAAGQITEEHGKALLSVADEGRRLDVWRKVSQGRLSVSETRKLALATDRQPTVVVAAQRPSAANDIHWVALEDRLRSALGMWVGLRPDTHGGGTVTIRFTEAAEIEGIIEKLQ